MNSDANSVQSLDRGMALVTGGIGLLAALLTGLGEFILHYDPLARFSEYAFFDGISSTRSTVGHFIAMAGAPLYLVGLWHIHLMLRPANPRWSLGAFLIGAYGFVLGAVWIGSRASASALINAPSEVTALLMGLYDLRYETLLQAIRVTVFLLSVVYVWLVLSGRSHYPKWMAALNPIVLIIASFLIYAAIPAIGKYLMPVALNVAFAVLLFSSMLIARNLGKQP